MAARSWAGGEGGGESGGSRLLVGHGLADARDDFGRLGRREDGERLAGGGRRGGGRGRSTQRERPRGWCRNGGRRVQRRGGVRWQARASWWPCSDITRCGRDTSLSRGPRTTCGRWPTEGVSPQRLAAEISPILIPTVLRNGLLVQQADGSFVASPLFGLFERFERGTQGARPRARTMLHSVPGDTPTHLDHEHGEVPRRPVLLAHGCKRHARLRRRSGS